MPKITLTKDEALDILEDGDIVRNKSVGRSRWSVRYELVFNLGGKLYRTYYSTGATEMQDEQPWQYDDTVECFEVREVPVTTVIYEAVE